MKAGIVNLLNNNVYRELAELRDNDPLDLEELFAKYEKHFHPNHFHLIGMKHSLSQVCVLLKK